MPEKGRASPAALRCLYTRAGARRTPVTATPLSPLADVLVLLERAVQASPADETELVYVEARHGETGLRGAREAPATSERTVFARVHERGRVGTHRTGALTPAELDSALRQALAQARVRAPLPGLPHLPTDPTPLGGGADLYDPEIAALDAARAQSLLRRWAAAGEQPRLRWSAGQFVVLNNRGVRREVRVTAAELEARSGQGPAAGRATGAARTLSGLGAELIAERARARRRAAAELAQPDAASAAVWLSGEAAAILIALLNHNAFTARAYRDGTSFLRDHLGTQVFDSRFTLRDDATDVAGLPFPFDLEGTAKRAVELVAAGTPRTPALDQRHAALLGLPATGHATAGDDARAENLFLLAGEATDLELAAAAEGGVFWGAITKAEVYDPRRMQVRLRATGVRRVNASGAGEALPDVLWEGSLLRAFSRLLAVGRESVRVTPGDRLLGGVVAPSLVVAEMPGLRAV